MNALFHKFALKASEMAGSAWVFIASIVLIGTWLAAASYLGYANTVQPIINTGTTIVTLLMVFLIQNTQNRHSRTMQLKLDELIQAAEGARNRLVNLQEMTDGELDVLQTEFQEVRRLEVALGVEPAAMEELDTSTLGGSP